VVFQPYLDGAGPQDVSRVPKTDLDTLDDIESFAVLPVLHLPDYALSFLECIQGFDSFTGLSATVLSIALGKVRGIRQQNCNQFATGVLGIYRTAETPFYEERQTPAMVKMSMAQHHRINPGRIEWKRVTVTRFILVAALDQAAIEQNLASANVQNMT